MDHRQRYLTGPGHLRLDESRGLCCLGVRLPLLRRNPPKREDIIPPPATDLWRRKEAARKLKLPQVSNRGRPQPEPLPPQAEPLPPQPEPLPPQPEPLLPRLEPLLPRLEPLPPQPEPLLPRPEPLRPRLLHSGVETSRVSLPYLPSFQPSRPVLPRPPKAAPRRPLRTETGMDFGLFLRKCPVFPGYGAK